MSIINISIILSVCMAVYAIFSYLEIRCKSKYIDKVIATILKKHGNEIIDIVTREIISDMKNMFLDNISSLAELGFLGALKEEMKIEKEITETGTENNKEFARD